MKLTAATLLLLGTALASPIDISEESMEVADIAERGIKERQSCPNIHLFGARETTVAPGYGTSATFINLVIQAYPGATEEAINYPACGGGSSCGGVSYANSVIQGVAAVASQVNAFNTKCPNTLLVLVGYSQGGQIMDDAFCGGGDSNEGLSSTAIPIQASAINQIKAVIFAGDPRHIPGLSYNVGTCQASGFAPRPSGFQCPSASKIQSYCDSADPYCCNGSSTTTHEGYGNEYGQAALNFIKGKLGAGTTSGGGGSTPTTTARSGATTTARSGPTTTAPSGGGGGGGGGTSQKYGQCGGIGWTGPTACASGSTCTYSNAYYSQCL